MVIDKGLCCGDQGLAATAKKPYFHGEGVRQCGVSVSIIKEDCQREQSIR